MQKVSQRRIALLLTTRKETMKKEKDGAGREKDEMKKSNQQLMKGKNIFSDSL